MCGLLGGEGFPEFGAGLTVYNVSVVVEDKRGFCSKAQSLRNG